MEKYIEYFESQTIDTNNKTIPVEYTEQDKMDFIKDMMKFLASLYNMTDKRSEFSRKILKCVEIFLEFNVTWQLVQENSTLPIIQRLLTMLRRTCMEDFLSENWYLFFDVL